MRYKKCTDPQHKIMSDIVLENGYKNICNIGVFKGGSVLALAGACKSREEGKVHCVDTWPVDEWHEFFLKLIVDYKVEDYCVPHKSDSVEFLNTTDETFDFAFIDGDHKKLAVKADILGCIRCGTTDILCHDWEDLKNRPGKTFGVKPAILELEAEGVIDITDTLEYMARIKPRSTK